MLPATQRPKAPKRSLELSPRTRHVLISVSLLLSFSFLFPFALSQTLQVHGMKEAKAYRFAYGVSGLLFCCFAVAWLYAYASDTEESRRRRDAAFSRRALKSQTFKCVSPQVPGEFVVFPVRVRKRGVAASRVVSLEADELRVELDTRARDAEGKIDSEGSLRALLEAALLPRFEAGAAEIVTFQGADGGPTGLAGGLALNRADFDLGRKVGCFLLDAAQGPS